MHSNCGAPCATVEWSVNVAVALFESICARQKGTTFDFIMLASADIGRKPIECVRCVCGHIQRSAPVRNSVPGGEMYVVIFLLLP